jgi:hypothetical protein
MRIRPLPVPAELAHVPAFLFRLLCGTLDGLLDLVGTEDVMTLVKAQTQTATLVETVVAPAAIERALSIYEQLQRRDQSVIAQARKILTQFIYGLVDQGEQDEQRLTVGGLALLKAIERDHAIKSAYEASEKDGASSSP